MLQEDYEMKPPPLLSSKSKTQQQQGKGKGLIEEIVNLNLSESSSSCPNFMKEEGEEEGGDENQDETITTVLALLGSIMELGSFQRNEKEEKILRTLILPSLQTIATSSDSDTSLREMASDVALMIMVRGENGKRKKQQQGVQGEEEVKSHVLPGDLNFLVISAFFF
jgi:hypothetical protein